jgi:hypothetical protein
MLIASSVISSSARRCCTIRGSSGRNKSNTPLALDVVQAGSAVAWQDIAARESQGNKATYLLR